MRLLTRDEFRHRTLMRNGGVCVVPQCLLPAVDAHHILNRNLFTEADEQGGYFYENGAGLCASHHLNAERTIISTTDLYQWCEIDAPAIPHTLDASCEYDTWGNAINADGTRVRGPLFSDSGCQKALKAGGVLWTFGFEGFAG